MAQKPLVIGKPGAAAVKALPPPRTFMRDDFPYIRKASLTFAICLALSIALVAGSDYLLSRHTNAKNQAQAQHSQANEKYAQAEIQKRDIRDFAPKYAQLVARGFVGEEKRLDWMESIGKIQERRKLLPIVYEIFPQQPFQIDPALYPTLENGELELRGSKMQVSIDLLHEMDLLNFLHDLKRMQTYALNECAIKSPSTSTSDLLSPRLTAECTLYWVTIGPRNVAGEEAATDQ